MKFYRDVLNGPLYIIVVVISVILIMAIIGFIMERKQLAKAAANKVAHVDQDAKPAPEVQPIPEVKVAKPKAPAKESKPKPKEVINFTPEAEIPVANTEIKVEDKK